MEITHPDHAFWQACRRLLQEEAAAAAAAMAPTATAAATALAQALAAGRQEAASEALATLLLDGGDRLSQRVEREFRPGAWSINRSDEWIEAHPSIHLSIYPSIHPSTRVKLWMDGTNRLDHSTLNANHSSPSLHSQTVLIDLVARLLHRSITDDDEPAAADTAEAVAKHLALFARLLPVAPHTRALAWEVGELAFFCYLVTQTRPWFYWLVGVEH